MPDPISNFVDAITTGNGGMSCKLEAIFAAFILLLGQILGAIFSARSPPLYQSSETEREG